MITVNSKRVAFSKHVNFDEIKFPISMGRIRDDDYERMSEQSLDNKDEDSVDSAYISCNNAMNGGL